MNDETPPPLPVEFKDRKTSLTVFGILTILGGLLCALMVPRMIFTQSMSQHTAGAPPPASGLVMASVFYGGLAVALVWLGIGSIMARRWARALLQIMSWYMLIIGLIVIAILAAMSGSILAAMPSASSSGPGLSQAVKWTILMVTAGLLSVIFVIIPAIWVFVYGSKNVKATCEARDPRMRWTDRCPLPVLVASLFLTFGAASLLIAAFSFHGVTPFFGVFLVGLPGILLSAFWTALYFYSAWATYRLDSRGWWAGVVSVSVPAISGALTYHRQGFMEFYKLAGYTGEQLASVQRLGFLNGDKAVWFTLACALPWLVYLLFVKKYFRQGPR